MVLKCAACMGYISPKEKHVKAEIQVGPLEITTMYFHSNCYRKDILEAIEIRITDSEVIQ